MKVEIVHMIILNRDLSNRFLLILKYSFLAFRCLVPRDHSALICHRAEQISFELVQRAGTRWRMASEIWIPWTSARKTASSNGNAHADYRNIETLLLTTERRSWSRSHYSWGIRIKLLSDLADFGYVLVPWAPAVSGIQIILQIYNECLRPHLW